MWVFFLLLLKCVERLQTCADASGILLYTELFFQVDEILILMVDVAHRCHDAPREELVDLLIFSPDFL